jgi:hypothetical protein
MLLATAGRVDRPDHTAHIRAELARSALYCTTGLVVVPAAAGTTFLSGQATGMPTAPAWLMRVLWIVGAFAVTVSAAGLARVLVRCLVYLRRRAELDAEGAHAMGEINARLADRNPEP